MPNRFVYTVTTGRSGTAFLSELLKANLADATVVHEHTHFLSIGRRTPEISQLLRFNMLGNRREIRYFWKHKFSLDMAEPTGTYAECAHMLAKAGLIENLDQLPEEAEIDVVHLTRDVEETAWSIFNRGDYRNFGFSWLWALDPRAKNIIVPSADFLRYEMVGCAIWYVTEMRARGAYYRQLLGEGGRVRFHEIDLAELATEAGAERLLSAVPVARRDRLTMPPRANAGTSIVFEDSHRDRLQKMVAHLARDYEQLGEDFYRSGKRLATPSLSGATHLEREAAT